MASPFQSNEIISSTPTSIPLNESHEATQRRPIDLSILQDDDRPSNDSDQLGSLPEYEGPRDEDCITNKKRRKTSVVWNDFHEIDVAGGGKKAVCNYCKEKLATGGRGANTSHLKRHFQSCLQKRLHMAWQKKQTTIPFHPSNSGINPFVTPGAKYSNEKMREIIASAIMVHKHPFSIVEDEIWMWGFQYANPEFQKISRKIARADCLTIYEVEKKKLKALLKSMNKISITTDMWKSSHQVAEYMVITGHFIDGGWSLQKRVLSFEKVPAPRRGVDVADAIFTCLKAWRIENKVFLVFVDNASYNDSCIRNLKENLSLCNKLVLDGELFHVRCCAHILNLLVQDGLGKIKNVIHNIRESVKYINHSDSRLKAFCDVVEQKRLKERKLIIDCPTRWNSTFEILSSALKFKIAFSAYKEREPHYDYAPSPEDWEKVEKVYQLLEVFSLATHIISSSEYPTANLYLAEVYRVKEVIDAAARDWDFFIKEMAKPMKEKFDKYWGKCNETEAEKNVNKVHTALQVLYDEYVNLSREKPSSCEVNTDGSNSLSTAVSKSSFTTEFDQIMSIVHEKEAVPPLKSELESYLEEGVYISDSSSNSSFSALEWWRNNSLKYKILSKMAADILAIPISTVALESTFSAGGRIIDEYRAKLNEESVEALICGEDWLRNKYGLKRKQKESEQEEITLRI
ncbi:zinc finger BED domain-containing protein RICESLEEPER 2-like [Elaeis guineensis]|uniref:Zinc finger BED domain-containing protein RICESLEEPER 2-like n=1 Tax=Elaeis guineensis var. tenera TaxID=51953 RepID=A0A6I9QZL0_ELAGV|nr:zinc finger BED domain-containing protein RICESLEEPER 2-like [Elaeis guineensis]